MMVFTNFLRSVLLAIVLSFIAPILFVGFLLSCLCLFGLIPVLHGMTQDIPNDILNFLATFGTGSPLHGLLIIGLTFGFVGGLFDVYVYYRHQVLSFNSEGLIQNSTITVFCESLENEEVYLKPLTRTPGAIS
ncbi:hypothetical protein [Cylindrospermopsis raciborskii]|uniref:Uncharacterized protein n=3 Tax=Cylindrospermopsis raciborskii TaxID=77022 RepID=A0A9Q5QZU0_9CYAN|nr:hypothetical protein [Cylindrospermopsis raciborskii]NLQ05221.1 hypothetical protein [Cylindrospermopsis raciborskii MVCC19]OHY32693.1 hypothetical protein BCV64_11990 [Cylindrospermopsis raciborskii MVCC14]OPH11134.1 hypothetical protein CENA302_02040 [Cylindrospermopsis raciborskii CENA302]